MSKRTQRLLTLALVFVCQELLAAEIRTAPNVTKAGYREGPPAGKQWKMVWNDEFDGTTVDANKWNVQSQPTWNWPGVKTKESTASLSLDGQGSLVLQLTQDADGTVRYHPGMNSRFEKAYGYFETRVQFSRQPGWWTAVWLAGYPYDDGPDAFVNSQEFDIFEDFYKPKNQDDIQHCYHCSAVCGFGTETVAAGYGKYGKVIEVRDVVRVSAPKKVILEEYAGWHTVGFQWTPLEHIFYVDGQETFRMNYREVPVTTVPQKVWISSCLRVPTDKDAKPFYGRLEEAKFPDRLMVDYVRVYEEDPGARKPPAVTLAMNGTGPVKKGEPVKFDVSATDADGKVVSVMLFSMGRLRAEAVADSAEAKTTFNVDSLFLGPNTVIAMAKDDGGLVGMSAPLRVEVVTGREYTGTPYGGKPQAIPGKITAGHYDLGGQGVAYFTSRTDSKNPDLKFRADEIGLTNTPEAIPVGGSGACGWATYTVAVEKPGEYEVELFLNRPDYYTRGMATGEKTEVIQLDVDQQKLAEWGVSSQWTSRPTWRVPIKPVGRQKVRLTVGQHKLIVRFDRVQTDGFHFGGFEFKPVP